MTVPKPHGQILHCLVDEWEESNFRILVDGKYYKYINVDPGLYDTGKFGAIE
jgi:hypothetical protein